MRQVDRFKQETRGGLKELIFEDVTRFMFGVVGCFPTGQIRNTLAVVLMLILPGDPADSGMFVLSTMTTDGTLNPPVLQTIVRGTLIAAITVVMLFPSSVTVAKAMAIIS